MKYLSILLLLITTILLANAVNVNQLHNNGISFNSGNNDDELITSFRQKVHQTLYLDSKTFVSFTDISIPVNKHSLLFNYNTIDNGGVGKVLLNGSSNIRLFSKLLDIIPSSKGSMKIINCDIDSGASDTASFSEWFLESLLNIPNVTSSSSNNSNETFVVDITLVEALKYFKNFTTTDNGTIIAFDSDNVKLYFKYKNQFELMKSFYFRALHKASLPNATSEEIDFFNNNKAEFLKLMVAEHRLWNKKGKENDYIIRRNQIETILKEPLSNNGNATENLNYYINYLINSMNGSSTQYCNCNESKVKSFYPTFYYPNNFLVDNSTFFNNGSLSFNNISFSFNSSIDNISSFDDENQLNSIGGISNMKWEFSLSMDSNSSSCAERKVVPLDTDDMFITFEIVKIPVHRPWFDELIISNGIIDAPADFKLYTTTVLIAKNIKITLNQNNTDIINQIQSANNVWFGSFLLKGSVEYSNVESNFTITNDNVIECSEMQIIGFICDYLESNSTIPTPTPTSTYTPSPTPSNSTIPTSSPSNSTIPTSSPSNSTTSTSSPSNSTIPTLSPSNSTIPTSSSESPNKTTKPSPTPSTPKPSGTSKPSEAPKHSGASLNLYYLSLTMFFALIVLILQ